MILSKASFLILCVAAVAFSFGFKDREERAAATFAAGLILTNWLFVEWTYSEGSPQALLGSVGLHFKAQELWALADALTGVFVLATGLLYGWAWVIWTVCLFQEGVHFAQLSDVIDADHYLFALDAGLLVQLAVFFWGGRHGARDLMLSIRRGEWRVPLRSFALQRVRRR